MTQTPKLSIPKNLVPLEEGFFVLKQRDTVIYWNHLYDEYGLLATASIEDETVKGCMWSVRITLTEIQLRGEKCQHQTGDILLAGINELYRQND